MAQKILSFGGGVQTTALAILAAKHEVEVDAAIFADPGGEKPETYWYIEAYIKPLFKEAGIPFEIVKNERKSYQPDLYGYLYRLRDIPSVQGKRECSWNFKRLVIQRHTSRDSEILLGFSFDEQARLKEDTYPLVDLKLTGADCHRIISDYGWPVPVKSSCFFCPFQRWTEWNWFKIYHPELIEKSVALEARFYERKPHYRETVGLFGGAPLWKYAQGIQMEMPILKEYSCWSGACGH